MRTVAADVEAVQQIPVVSTVLEVMARTTGMRFTAIARVSESSWTACAVHDEIAFGLRPGGELELVTTICNEVRQHGQAVIFGSARADPRFRDHPTPKLYGFESYVSIPIVRGDGSFFGTLCAIDPRPAQLDGPNVLRTLELFASLIAMHLDAQDRYALRGEALATATDTAQQLQHENRRIAALMAERERAEQAITRELEDTRRLRDVAARLIGGDDTTALYAEILDAAIGITEADAGTLQFLDAGTQTLRLLATRGFEPDILAHFAQVDASSGSSCGAALRSGQRSVVVFDDPAVPDVDGAHRWHLEAGMRCAQSTPLLSRSGRPLGMFSTHWSARRELGERELRFLDLLGRQAADLIERNEVQKALEAGEQRLRQEAQRKDEFIAVLAHELRNPLAPIRSGIELLKRAPPDPLTDRVRPMMARQVDHMVRLVDDLLDVSRISSGRVQLKPERVSLSRLVGSAVEAHRAAIEAAGIELCIELDAPDRLLDVDPTRLSQVISNVLHNAAKFTVAPGRITLCTTFEPAHGDAPSTQVICIADTGVGIPAEQQPGIFELFAQANPGGANRHGGMGIGLALARSLMALHGGTITAHSDGAGQGSQFTLRLPVVEGDLAANGVPPRVAADGLAGVRALVVDDNRDAADVMGLLLAQHGAEVSVTYGALEALETVHAFAPTLVLLDIGMPEIDGYEACRRLRAALGAGVRIVALTGWGQEEDRRRSAAAGFDAHLTKPVDFALLLALALPVPIPDTPDGAGTGSGLAHEHT